MIEVAESVGKRERKKVRECVHERSSLFPRSKVRIMSALKSCGE